MKSLYIDIFSKLFLIFNGLIFFFLHTMKIDIIKMLRMNSFVKYIFVILIGLATFNLMFNRDFYLPFLGKCAFPSQIKTNNSNVTLIKKVDVRLNNLPPNTNIVYWAAKQSNSIINDYIDAYKSSRNVGMTKTDNNGTVTIQIDCPAQYKVPMYGIPGFEKTLERHIHYRYALPEYEGMFSKVYTQKIDC